MNVKCPKCRYRFDVTAPPGMTLLQCNCPRCGTPFTYSAESGEDAGPSNHRRDGVVESQPRHADEAVGLHPSSSASSTEGARDASMAVPPPIPPKVSAYSDGAVAPPPSPSASASTTPVAAPPAAQGRGYIKGCLLGAVGLLVVIVLALYRCGASTSYTADSLELVEDSDSEVVTSLEPMSTPPYDERAAAERAPSWIQGNWHVDTDYGGISLKIYGDNIAETSGGETSYGHFKYQNHRLYCDFGDNSLFVYRLVEETRQIDAGNGVLMEKLD